MNFLDKYDLTSLNQSQLIALEYEVKEALIRFSNKSLEIAKKESQAFLPTYMIGFMVSYITFIMTDWLTSKKAKLHKNELIDFITREATHIHDNCNQYNPHQKDDAHAERMNLFRENIKPYSTIAQTAQLERSICDNAIESRKTLIQSGNFSSKPEKNAFTFIKTIPFVCKEVKKLKKEIKDEIDFDDNSINAFLTKQFARQIAWCAGFFANLDKDEPIENIIKFVEGILETLDFNDQLSQL